MAHKKNFFDELSNWVQNSQLFSFCTDKNADHIAETVERPHQFVLRTTARAFAASAIAYLDVVASRGPQPLHILSLDRSSTVEGWMQGIAELCVLFVLKNDDDGSDIPFEVFARAPSCQIVSQATRIAQWLYFVSDNGITQLATLASSGRMYPGVNAHSSHLLAFFSEETDMEICYPANTGADRLSLQETLLQRTLHSEDLPWGRLEADLAFPYSLDNLMRIILYSADPIKVLLAVSPNVLFDYLSRCNATCIESLRKLSTYLTDPTVLQYAASVSKLENGDDDPLNRLLSICKWCFVAFNFSLKIEPSDITVRIKK